ncbi:MAG: M48 family metallopeptidase [Armatimonadota bacterium]
MSKRACAAFVLALVSCSIFTGCSPRSLVSTSQEVDIGRQASRDVERQYRLSSDRALQARVNQIGQTLVGCSTRQDITYTFKVLESKEVNAFSLPGGWVYIFTGLTNQTRNNPDELAGVIAHEIGHIAARHHADMIGRQLYAQILVGTLTRGQVQDIAAIFANISLLRWSRKHEYESDRLGLRMMYGCRSRNPELYNPEGLIDFFARLLAMEGREPSEFQQIFRTHPVTSDRIQRAREYLSELRAGRANP